VGIRASFQAILDKKPFFARVFSLKLGDNIILA